MSSDERSAEHNLASEDVGGSQSRNGFLYQDLCAVRFGIAAINTGNWVEIHCESHGDIRLTGKVAARLIQVKYRSAASKHWSCADLCRSEREGLNSVDDSLLGKLLAQDPLFLNCDFRLVTNEGVSEELRPFHYRWGWSEAKAPANCSGAQDLSRRLSDWTHKCKRTTDDHILAFAVEQHSGDATDLEASIAAELSIVLRTLGIELLMDQLFVTLRTIYFLVHRAAATDKRATPRSGTITLTEFVQQIRDRASDASENTMRLAAVVPGDELRAQLSAAEVGTATISYGIECRRQFMAFWMKNRGTAAGAAIELVIDRVAEIATARLVATLEGGARGQALVDAIIEDIDDYVLAVPVNQRPESPQIAHGVFFYLLTRGRIELAA